MGCNTSQEVKAKKPEEDGLTEVDGKSPENEQTTPAMNGDASAPSVEDSCSDAAKKSSTVSASGEAVTKEPIEREQNAKNNGIQQQQHGKHHHQQLQQQKKPAEVASGDVTIVDDGKHHNGLVNGDINDDTSSSNVKRCDKAEISELNNVDIDGDEEELEDDDKDDANEDDEEKAATKIQAAFRGHKVRATMKKSDDTSAAAAASTNKNTPADTEANSKSAATAAAVEADPTKEELEAEFDPNDKDLCNAALKIQATFRGHLSRKLVGTKEPEDIDIQEITKKVAEELDIDLSDPELNKAATKIQASFRGHKSRKDIPA